MKLELKSLIRKVLPRKVRPYKILSGPLKGQKIVTSWHDYPASILGKTELQLINWFKINVKQGETWIDIGAHYGYTSIALCNYVGPKGRVFAFEPMLATVGYLAKTRIINNYSQLFIFPFALSNIKGISISRLPVTRGMLDSTYNPVEKEKIDEIFYVTNLDWVWAFICGDDPQISGIKIDVQGMEMFTLLGMKDYLITYHPKLIVEFHSCVNRDQILDFLKEIGYSKIALPIEPQKGELVPMFFDNRSYYFEYE